MQRKFLASAVALGLSASLITAPVADAAQIGPKDYDATCSVRLTDAEQRYLEQQMEAFNVTTLAEAGVASVESVYPDFKELGDRVANAPEVREIVSVIEAGKKPADAQYARLGLRATEEENRFDDVNKQYTYEAYLEAKMLSVHPSLRKVIDEDDLLGDLIFSKVEASREPVSAPDLPGYIIDALEISGDKAAQARKAFAATPFGQKWPAFADEFARAMGDAQTACADGGKRDVKFPTAKTTKTDQTKTDQTKPGDKAGDKATDNAKNNGSSEDTGKIIGIIAGVLVALGLIAGGVVAFAPQLGITLPF